MENNSKNKENIGKERLSAIGEMAARISHDMRNPLATLSIAIENLKLLVPNNEKTDKQFGHMDKR